MVSLGRISQEVTLDVPPVISAKPYLARTAIIEVWPDFLFCFGKQNTGPGRFIAKLQGIYDRLSMSRTMKALVKDKNGLARTARSI